MPRIRTAALAAAVVTLFGTATANAAQPFSETVFTATHNSYSGNVDGAKGSIVYQLDQGVRFVELDIHDKGYGDRHDYGIGHSSPGDLVDHAGNPASNSLRDWLAVVNSWSAAHPAAAPIVVMLDIKDDLTDNASFAAGNLGALNAELSAAFGPRLLSPAAYRAGASTDSLRGKVLPLLSGDDGTRAAYRRDVGYHPAVAVNNRGQVVEVHDSGDGSLWYWTGQYRPDGRIAWQRHGRYDSGQTPAVAIDHFGQVVEVHQSQNAATLWYRTGRLGADGEISWSASRQYDTGVQPTVAFSGNKIREIHRSPANDQNWQWRGKLTGDGTVSWTGNEKTGEPAFDKTTAVAGPRRVRVSTGADNGSPAQTLRYSTGRVASDRIQYQQVAFDEYQQGDADEMRPGALFAAAPAQESAFLIAARKAGMAVRGWNFDNAGYATDPPVNYPATNHPYDDWYRQLTKNAAH